MLKTHHQHSVAMQQAYCNAVANGTSVTNYPSVFYMESLHDSF